MRLLICAGGTGGGVYPALAVLQALKGDAVTLWVGGEGGMEARLLERANVPFKTIPAAGVHGVGARALPGNSLRLVRGYFAARRIIRDFKPDVLFFTGGFLAVPMAFAGMNIPTLLYVPDIEPALALKTLSRFADRIAVTSKDSFEYFKQPDRLVVTGFPTRSELVRWDRAEARRELKLDDHSPVLLVFGGSKGARTINNAVFAHLPALLEKAQVVHITGELDWPNVSAKTKDLPELLSPRYHAFPYLHEQMGAALAAADLVVSRAGASTLGELPLFGLPAILVPYPYAWRYQKVNADYLVRCGGAVSMEDACMNDDLLPAIIGLLEHPEKLASMRLAMLDQSRPHAAEEIGGLLYALSGERR